MTYIPVTKINFNGHKGYDLNTVLDLAIAPTTYQEEWAHQYWQRELDGINRDEKQNHHLRVTPGFEEEAEQIRKLMKEINKFKHSCGECGEYISFTIDGDTMTADSVCAEPGGLKAYSVSLNVPSGKIVFANDLRELTLVEDDFDVNKTVGQKAMTQGYATQGLAIIFVGNTCPGVYTKGNTLVVASMDDENDSEEENADLVDHGSICTDLWWYSAMDYDLFLERCDLISCDPESFDIFTVEVEPGTYTFTDELADRDAEGTIIFSTIARTYTPAPKPYYPSRATGTTVEESGLPKIVERMNRNRGLQHKANALDLIFFGIGFGYRWTYGTLRNVDGHGDDTPYVPNEDIDTPLSFPIPTLEGLTNPIYPASPYSPFACMPENVDIFNLAAALLLIETRLTLDFTVMGRDAKNPELNELEKTRVKKELEKGKSTLLNLAAYRGWIDTGMLKKAMEEVKAYIES